MRARAQLPLCENDRGKQGRYSRGLCARWRGDFASLGHCSTAALSVKLIRCSPYGSGVLTVGIANNRYAVSIFIPSTHTTRNMSTRGGPSITHSSYSSWHPVRSVNFVPTVPSLSELLETLCVELRRTTVRGHPHSARTASSSRLQWDRGRSRPSAECALAFDGRFRRSRSW